MQGQWIHSVENGGKIVIEIDHDGSGYNGHICVYIQRPLVGVIKFRSATGAPIVRENLTVIYHQREGAPFPLPFETVQERYPNEDWLDNVLVSMELRKDRALTLELSGVSTLNNKLAVSVTIPASRSTEASELSADAEIVSWADFKRLVGTLVPQKFVFRGQSINKRLRSSFHRTNRKSLINYVDKDVFQIHKAITTSTANYFNLNDDNHYAAFLNLLQHHGYPTPLLDWTHSPYVAAYFAFRQARREPKSDDRVRIFMFDAAAWSMDCRQIAALVYTPPHLSLLEPLALENPRSAPQQALSAVVTVDDVEGYIEEIGRQSGHDYMRVFDLPYSERGNVLKELKLMGITAATMFPGLDGVCEAMRIQNFED